VIKFFDIIVISGVCAVLVQSHSACASEILLEGDINARAEYDDNIFLTNGPHDAVSGILITPAIAGIIREANWEANLEARLRINKYSDNTIDGNDQFFDLTGQYNAQRDIFSLNINHFLDSNLSSASTDFGIVGRRVDRTSQSVTPQYTRLLTERLVLSLSYSYSDVDFDDIESSGFTPYLSETGSASLRYELTERDQFSLNFQIVDYRSKNDLQTFDLFTSSIGIDHKFSETLSTDFLIGVSQRDSTNLDTTPFDFFGQIIERTQVIDFNSNGLVLDAGITKILESGTLTGRVSRNDTTNSFGGVDQVDRVNVVYDERLSSLWRYNINIRFDDIKSVSNNVTSDRDIFIFETRVSYSITPKWSANTSYRYVARRFKSDTSEDRTPDSNRVFIGLIYNFPSLSTF